MNKVESLHAELLVILDEVSNAAVAYYTNGDSKMSDDIYDSRVNTLRKIIKELRKLKPIETFDIERAEAFLNSVGTTPLGKNQVKHKHPMLSLSNIYYYEGDDEPFIELRRWITDIHATLGTVDVEFIVEPKFDGLALSMDYEKSSLRRAYTRGDGSVGEEVKHPTVRIDGFPSFCLNVENVLKEGKNKEKYVLIGNFTVRGEVVMYKSTLRAINADRIETGLPALANTRNAAVGALKSNDYDLNHKLQFIPYELFVNPDANQEDLPWFVENNLDTVSKRLEWLDGIQFTERPKNYYLVTKSKKEIEDFYLKMIDQRESLKMDLDGLVIKVNDTRHWEKLGSTSKSPRYATAFKFPAKRSTIKLLDIAIQVGRTGQITPVGIVEPVVISGAVISNVTLHNFKIIEDNDIRIGDTIVIERSGDVIPKFVEVHNPDPNRSTSKYTPPTHCLCGSVLVQSTAGTGRHLFCENPYCDETNLKAFEHMFTRDALDVDGIGPVQAKQMYDYIKNFLVTLLGEPTQAIEDIIHTFFRFIKEKPDVKDLFIIEAFGVERYSRTYENISLGFEGIYNVPLHRFLYALGAPLVGRTLTKKLDEYFGSLEALKAAPWVLMVNLPQIGTIKGTAFFEWLHKNKDYLPDVAKFINVVSRKPSDELLNVVDDTLNNYIPKMTGPEDYAIAVNKFKDTYLKDVRVDLKASNALKGKTFVITGTLTRDRDTVVDLIKENGGKVSSKVNKSTTYLVLGDGGHNTSKHKDALKYGTEIIDESQCNLLLIDHIAD